MVVVSQTAIDVSVTGPANMIQELEKRVDYLVEHLEQRLIRAFATYNIFAVDRRLHSDKRVDYADRVKTSTDNEDIILRKGQYQPPPKCSQSQ